MVMGYHLSYLMTRNILLDYELFTGKICLFVVVVHNFILSNYNGA